VNDDLFPEDGLLVGENAKQTEAGGLLPFPNELSCSTLRQVAGCQQLALEIVKPDRLPGEWEDFPFQLNAAVVDGLYSLRRKWATSQSAFSGQPLLCGP
jgi:hypothetical protein